MFPLAQAASARQAAPEAVRWAMRAGWPICLYTVTALNPGLPPGAHHDASRACRAEGGTAGGVEELARNCSGCGGGATRYWLPVRACADERGGRSRRQSFLPCTGCDFYGRT